LSKEDKVALSPMARKRNTITGIGNTAAISMTSPIEEIAVRDMSKLTNRLNRMLSFTEKLTGLVKELTRSKVKTIEKILSQ
jgi:hypothetical protein